MKKQCMVLLVENNAGVLARISSLFVQRGFNIDSLTVSPTENEKVSRLTIMSTGDEKSFQQIIKQTGKLIETKLSEGGVTVRGFIGRPDNIRANRNQQNFFINGRYVKSRTACAALEQAYTSYIPPEKFPCCVLRIDVNPNAVDVNVHPAKLEVKFANEKPVFEAIYHTVKTALEENTTRPEIQIGNKKQEILYPRR